MSELNLSEREREEIKAYLDRGQKIPARYKALLFEQPHAAELIWPGKTSEVTNVVLPFQSIEQIDEPRKEDLGSDLFAWDRRTGRQTGGWTNKLIWGDNKLVLSSLKNGPMRQQIEDAGGLKLVYIDPPFDVGADFSFDIKVGDGEIFERDPSVIEDIAYRDTWGRGVDSYLSMLHDRLTSIATLLHPEGSIYVHLGPNISHPVKVLLDEIFGSSAFKSEIIWRRSNSHNKTTDQFGPIHDSILFYTKSANFTFHPGQRPFSKGYIESRFKYRDKNGIYQPNYLTGPGTRSGDSGQPWQGFDPTKAGRHWAIPSRLTSLLPEPVSGKSTREMLDLFLENDLLVIPKKAGGQPMYKQYLTDGVPYQDVWAYQPNTAGMLYGSDEAIDQDVKWLEQEPEKLEYVTQKPEGLIKRILTTSSDEGDLVADFFCGSGTALAAAEKMGRKWIGVDLGRFAIHTTRKRLIGVQRELKAAEKPYRSFEILNLGRYERQYFVGIDPTLPEEQRKALSAQKEDEFLQLILQAYKAERVEQSPPFHGRKSGAFVVVGPIDAPVTSSQVAEAVTAAKAIRATRVDILGFEFEMGIVPHAQEEARAQGVALTLRQIPKDVFDKRAVEKNQVAFHDVAYVDAKAAAKGLTVEVSLTDFGVFYSQGDIDAMTAAMKSKSTKVQVDRGQVWKVSKDKDGIVTREQLTKHWTDWIDYWAVDFDFESKCELVTITDAEGQQRQVGTGGYIFENEWQSFRTRKNRSLELTSAEHDYSTNGRYKIAVKVIDIFGNDTTKVFEVQV